MIFVVGGIHALISLWTQRGEIPNGRKQPDIICSYGMENVVRGTCYFLITMHCVIVVALLEGIGQNLLSLSEYFNSK